MFRHDDLASRRVMQSATALVTTLLVLSVAACSSETPPSSSIDAPMIDATPMRTNQSPLTITGHGTAGATLQVRGGADPVASATVGSDGAFSVMVALRPNTTNTLVFSQTSGSTESTSVMRTVVHDGMAPMTPVLDPLVSPTRRTTATVRGRTEAGARLAVTGGMAPVMGTADTTGRFTLMVPLTTSATVPVPNMLSLTATDDVGNASAPLSFSITYDPTLAVEAPLVDAIAPTNDVMVNVTGSAEASVTITIAGAVDAASGSTDASGAFSIPVELHPNASNALFVFAVSGGQTSAAAPLTVIHDDVPPSSPSLDPQASPTSLETLTLTGTAEPGATLSVMGGAGAAMAIADASGAFSVEVDLTVDATNDLSVVATDAATNASEPTTLSIVQDSTLDAPVVIDPAASPTATNPVHLTGRSEPSAMVQIVGGVAQVDVMADASGVFGADVMLHPNESNELHAHRAGSGADTIVVIVHDDMAPAAPTVSSIASPTGATSVVVSGTTEPRVHVSVTGGVSAVTGNADDTGSFALGVSLASDTTATLAVVATDRAGNSSAATTLMVQQSTSTPAAPILDQPAPPPTRNATYHLTGRVSTPGAGITVSVTGGMATASGPADPSTGVFAIDVMLNPNDASTLDVTSSQGSITSPPARVVVVHDSIAPVAPAQASITARAPALTSCLLRRTTTVSGAASSVEARSTVRITNTTAAANVSATATDTGTFSGNLNACPGDLLSITATDAAGNVSTATTVTVQ